jgi:hypothetical protein
MSYLKSCKLTSLYLSSSSFSCLPTLQAVITLITTGNWKERRLCQEREEEAAPALAPPPPLPSSPPISANESREHLARALKKVPKLHPLPAAANTGKPLPVL